MNIININGNHKEDIILFMGRLITDKDFSDSFETEELLNILYSEEDRIFFSTNLKIILISENCKKHFNVTMLNFCAAKHLFDVLIFFYEKNVIPNVEMFFKERFDLNIVHFYLYDKKRIFNLNYILSLIFFHCNKFYLCDESKLIDIVNYFEGLKHQINCIEKNYFKTAIYSNVEYEPIIISLILFIFNFRTKEGFFSDLISKKCSKNNSTYYAYISMMNITKMFFFINKDELIEFYNFFLKYEQDFVFLDKEKNKDCINMMWECLENLFEKEIFDFDKESFKLKLLEQHCEHLFEL